MKIDRKVLLFLLIIMTTAVIFPPRTMAQGEKIDLSLSLVPYNYYQKVKPGKDNKFYLEVRNRGNQLITNIRLSADKPEGWTVEFKPSEYSSLSAGTVQTSELSIVPAAKAQRGEYQVTFIADATETRRVITSSFTVESNSLWLKIGAVTAFIVAGVFVFIFLKFGRQH